MPKYNNKNIVLHELIGLGVEVVNSSDVYQMGIRGTVIDETKNMLVVRASSGVKRIQKKTSTFKFITEKDAFTVSGVEINFRPHERIEKSLKFYGRRRA
ncbi:MAG: ribonuclease P protein subunit [Candidatus Marsarchaeota archaeon]|jgi:ribonuclease P protein subunit POP4|nr:ribonuclease P protein subunit [Candidatus Marsarchaeota archaeon]